MRNALLMTIILYTMILTGLSPLGANQLPRRKANKPEQALAVVRSASTRERHRWKGPLDCSAHPISQDLSRAEVVLIVAPEGHVDAVPHWNVCRITRVLKSGDKQSLRRGDQIIVEVLPTETNSESYLIFCRQSPRGEIVSLEFQGLSDEAERFVRSLSEIESAEQLIEFLFEQMSNTDVFVRDATLAELSAIPFKTFQEYDTALPDELIRRRALFSNPNQTTDQCHTAWKIICLQLLPLVARPTDVSILEKLVYQTSDSESGLKLMYLDTFAAMADQVQLQFLSRKYIRPEQIGADDPEMLSDLYKTYCALRNHRDRPAVAKVWHHASKRIVIAKHVMADIVLDDYRRITGWRFVNNAIRFLNENEPSEIISKACLRYVLQAHKHAIQSQNGELSKQTGRFLESYVQVHPDAVNEAQKLLKLFGQPLDAPSSP